MHPHHPSHTFTLNTAILLLKIKVCLELSHKKSVMFQNATNNFFRMFMTQIDGNNHIKKDNYSALI